MPIPFINRARTIAVAPTPQASAAPRIGLALGSGAAHGWTQIGILQVLEAHGLRPDIIAGSSIGAVVGGCYAAGKLADLEDFARSLTPRRVFSLMDFTFSGAGLLSGGRLKNLLDSQLGALSIPELSLKFGAVATQCKTGQEVWLTSGPLCDAVRASYALPGIFEPVNIGGDWLFDGALANPVPVTLCRALGADLVIAVTMVADNFGRGGVRVASLAASSSLPGEAAMAGNPMVPPLPAEPPRRGFLAARRVSAPSIANTMLDAFNITQDRIARSRLAGDPPDAMIKCRVGKIGLFDFHRADELIALGKAAAEHALDDIKLEIGAALQPEG
ncbi:MAG: patatin-like phospholipase family protein [Hyphomicrobiales bacterium]|nr:patatin-like phospholipase family protein [Hyphomicrobiales bacterium]